MRQGAQGWCTGMTLRNGMGSEVGGEFRMGNTCTPMADSCEYCGKSRNNITKREKRTRIPLGPSGIFPSVTKQNKRFPESTKLFVAR